MTANNDKNRTYSVFYTPKVTGMHKVRLQPAATRGQSVIQSVAF